MGIYPGRNHSSRVEIYSAEGRPDINRIPSAGDHVRGGPHLPATNLKQLLLTARSNKIATGSFNVFNLESIQAIVKAAETLNQPVILMIGSWLFNDLHPADLHAVVDSVRKRASVPVCLHLDHGRSMDDIITGIRFGCDSVMIDGSSLPFEENVALTRRVVDLAHTVGISVEAELGHVGSAACSTEGEGDPGQLTPPEKVAEFVDGTGADCLAIAIGTAHGVYRQLPSLGFPRLRAIRAAVDTPLVLHGGSGTPDDQLRTAINNGICKINVGTDLGMAFAASLERIAAAGDLNPVAAVPRACRAITRVVQERIALFAENVLQ